MVCDRVVSKGRSYCSYYYPARCRWLIVEAFISHIRNNVWNISKSNHNDIMMNIQTLNISSWDMFSSRSIYRTYGETSLLARRLLPSSCVDLGGT
jgi:hypothetical protein